MRKSAQPRWTDKYCVFYRDFGHTTFECYALYYEIQTLIKYGILMEFLTDVWRMCEEIWRHNRDDIPNALSP